MGFNTLISGLLAGVADPLTDSLQEAVDHYAFADQTTDDYNKPTPGSATSRKCVVEKTDKLVRRVSEGDSIGELVQASWVLIFPRPVAVDPRDKFVLASGETGPILKVTGVVDPATSALYATEVFLG
jgi:hypothetical protein